MAFYTLQLYVVIIHEDYVPVQKVATLLKNMKCNSQTVLFFIGDMQNMLHPKSCSALTLLDIFSEKQSTGLGFYQELNSVTELHVIPCCIVFHFHKYVAAM